MFKKKVKYAFYTLGHPSDGFYEIRHRGRGSVGLSILFVFLFAVCFSASCVAKSAVTVLGLFLLPFVLGIRYRTSFPL